MRFRLIHACSIPLCVQALLHYPPVMAALTDLPQLRDAVQHFYGDLGAFVSGHFSALTNTWKDLKKSEQRQIMANLQVCFFAPLLPSRAS